MTAQEIREQTTTVRLYHPTTIRWWVNQDTSEMVMIDGGSFFKSLDQVRKDHGAGRWLVEYEERPYTEYRLNGEVKQTGTRQFRVDRGHVVETKRYNVAVWNGANRWKNGYKSFEPGPFIITDAQTRPSDLERVLRVTSPTCRNAVEVRFEKV